jgi:nitroimidazol reductase NimA-like FMN-containing flavoprotein (pyridoxamine 5'-phosphate oxidase superfamily)
MSLGPTQVKETAVEAPIARPLSPERCFSLLGEAKDGYLALSRGALPIVLPVSCALDGESLLLRGGPGSFDRVTASPGVVAFGTTIPSVDGTGKWDVLVQGRAEVVHGSATDVPPRLPFEDVSSTTVFRVTLERLTGWEYRPRV